jgi:hypothetical protein
MEHGSKHLAALATVEKDHGRVSSVIRKQQPLLRQHANEEITDAEVSAASLPTGESPKSVCEADFGEKECRPGRGSWTSTPGPLRLIF